MVLVEAVLANVQNLVLENHVKVIKAAVQVNTVVIVVKATLANVLHLVLESRVNLFIILTFLSITTTVHQVNIVVILAKILLAKILLANVLHLVLENHVNIFTSVDQANIVVLIKNVP